jgi:hypothetical protein
MGHVYLLILLMFCVSLNLFFRGDFSQPGHILGSPDGRLTQAVSERTMSPASNAVLRLITHMAMFIGANDHIDVKSKSCSNGCMELIVNHDIISKSH